MIWVILQKVIFKNYSSVNNQTKVVDEIINFNIKKLRDFILITKTKSRLDKDARLDKNIKLLVVIEDVHSLVNQYNWLANFIINARHFHLKVVLMGGSAIPQIHHIVDIIICQQNETECFGKGLFRFRYLD